ncbi:MAG: UDP-N-acetylmuramate dehydrogenase [Candidatus Omnitrophica bacterium]|nr:UDP-N-acetylmuramate dehydrogenase [Candidatus Omnitrophota bacterium]
MDWWKGLKGKIKFNEPLKTHTTFKIGGPARFFIQPADIEDLRLLLILLEKHKIPFFIIGAGSNLLVSDRGVNGAVIHLGANYFKRITFKGELVEAGGGLLLSRMLSLFVRYGLAGAEFLTGIPGTLAGAIIMNAGQGERGASISELVEKVTVMDYNGNVMELSKDDLRFGYRDSDLGELIVLGAKLRLVRKGKKEIKSKIREYLTYRILSQDISLPSAGCVFKNPPGYSAAKLIELCGLKGRSIGGAAISLKHANFIVNLNRAKAEDVLKLMDLIITEVRHRFNVVLEPEIKIWH